VAPYLGDDPQPNSYPSLTHDGDKEDHQAGALTPSVPDRDAFTAEAPPARVPLAESVRSFVDERRIALPSFGPSAVSLFWGILLILILGGALLSISKGGGDGLIIGVIILLLVLPGLQLGAALVTALILAVSARPDKRYQFLRLGKIVLGVLVGTLLGGLVMMALRHGGRV
jgi:hypothetical protein